MPNTLASLVPTLAALIAVLGLILIAGRLVRSTGVGRPRTLQRAAEGQTLSVLDTLMLDRSRRLHVIGWDGRSLILLTGGPTDQIVGWVPQKDNA